jgi:hypothetical protein
MAIKLGDAILQSEYNIQKYKAILEQFPDASLYDDIYKFRSKKVNNNFTKLKFITKYYQLRVIPYHEMLFEFNGRTEKVLITTIPKSIRLAYSTWSGGKECLKFAKLANLTVKFKHDMLNECRIEILKFIKKYNNVSLDTKNLDPIIKKLIILT